MSPSHCSSISTLEVDSRSGESAAGCRPELRGASRSCGRDTVYEAVCFRWCGLEVLGLSNHVPSYLDQNLPALPPKSEVEGGITSSCCVCRSRTPHRAAIQVLQDDDE